MVAPTSLAASTTSDTGCGNKNKLPPKRMILGFSSKIILFNASTSMFITSGLKGCSKVFNPLIPAALTFAWEMCPPKGMFIAIILSPALAKPKKAARFAVTPETG